jgi:hypothetical protein
MGPRACAPRRKARPSARVWPPQRVTAPEITDSAGARNADSARSGTWPKWTVRRAQNIQFRLMHATYLIVSEESAHEFGTAGIDARSCLATAVSGAVRPRFPFAENAESG